MKHFAFFTIALTSLVYGSCSSTMNTSGKITQDFFFHYVCDNGDTIDTFEGYIVKELHLDGTKKVQYQISPDDAAKIVTKLNEIRFFDMNAHPKSVYGDRWPNSLRVKLGDREKFVLWDNIITSNPSPFRDLHDLRDLILSIVHSSAAWQTLPPVHNPRL